MYEQNRLNLFRSTASFKDNRGGIIAWYLVVGAFGAPALWAMRYVDKKLQESRRFAVETEEELADYMCETCDMSVEAFHKAFDRFVKPFFHPDVMLQEASHGCREECREDGCYYLCYDFERVIPQTKANGIRYTDSV